MGRHEQSAYPGQPQGRAGLTIREAVATAAMQGILAASAGAPPAEVAAAAVLHADALLAELEKPR